MACLPFPLSKLPLPFGLGLLGLLLPISAFAQADGDGDPMGRNAVTVFGGVMTDNHWEEVFTPWTLEFRESTLAGLAVSHRLARFGDRLDVEIEGQVVRHFGDQDHWEFDLPISGRWRAFPWDDVVDTSFAWGIGPSYATDIPEVELANNESSARWLVYWYAELEFGAPGATWSGIVRLHHRSDAFGLLAEDGGSNALAIGLRRRF